MGVRLPRGSASEFSPHGTNELHYGDNFQVNNVMKKQNREIIFSGAAICQKHNGDF